MEDKHIQCLMSTKSFTELSKIRGEKVSIILLTNSEFMSVHLMIPNICYILAYT